MKNRIVQKLCSLLVSLVIMATIATCFIPDSKTPPKQILEAPILQAWRAWVAWISGGGTWSGGGDSKPDGN